MSYSPTEKRCDPGWDRADLESRREDAMRVWATSSRPLSVAVLPDVEARLILQSAFDAYIGAVDVAAIISAHASCERDLLSRVAHWAELGEAQPSRNVDRLALGTLIGHFKVRLPTELTEALERLNDRRRTLYHYGHSNGVRGVRETTTAFMQAHGQTALSDAYERRHQQNPDRKQLLQFAMDHMLQEHALEALTTALATRAWATSAVKE